MARKKPNMTVGWLYDPIYLDGGCYALFLGGRLFSEMAHKGRHKLTHERALELAMLWNLHREGA